MSDQHRRFAIAAAVLCALSGCACESDQWPVAQEVATAACPQWLADRLTLSVSAVPVGIPRRFSITSGTIPFEGNVARRVLVALAASGNLRGVRVSDSVLTVSTFGGIFADWAARSRRGAPHDLAGWNRSYIDAHNPKVTRGYSIAVDAGRLILRPFLRSGSLAPQTSEFDVVVIPGGAPVDEVTISTSRLWDSGMHAEPPGAVHIRLSPVEHMTVLDNVGAAVELDFLAGSGRRARQRWRCSVSTQAVLVDHDAELPPLWVLRTAPRRGRPSVLALYTPTVGPFRAVFTSPAIAAGFAQWLRETAATRIDAYEVGLLRPAEELHWRRPDRDHPSGSARERQAPRASQSAAARFNHASTRDIDVLRVSRLDEAD